MEKLLWLFFIPFITSAIAFVLPNQIPRRGLKVLAIILSAIPLSLLLVNHNEWIGTQVKYPWLPAISVEFFLKMDPLSQVFVYLTALIIPISLLAVSSSSLEYPQFFYGLVLLLQGLLIGFFTSRDLALFTLFWESMLLPLYFIINLWGGPQRRMASLKFLIYMLAGSALVVAAVLALYFTAASGSAGTFNMDSLADISASAPYTAVLAAVFLLAFAVKTPLFPFHAWLPDAYTQAPVAGTILLSAILSKAGIYGILRIGMELFPRYIQEWSPWLIGLAIAGVLYGGMAAWMQKDYKRLIAYSSFSHVNFILAGVFILSQTAQTGAILQAVNHGITIAALFLVAGWLEKRIKTTGFSHYSGLAKFLPCLCWVTLFFVLANVALPGTNNFIGEFLILFGLFGLNPWAAAILGLSVILSVMYMLRWMQKMYFQAPVHDQEAFIDIKGKELAIALPLAALILWIGIYPAPFLNQIKPAAEKIISIEEPK